MTEDQILEIMHRGCAKLGKECQCFPLKAGLVAPLENGWRYLGYVTLGARKSYDVYWHTENGKGWLWAWIKKPEVFERRPFVPPD